MSLSPSGMGMIDRASAEITRCIMRIKKKKETTTSNNNGGTSSQQQQSPNNGACPNPNPKSSTGGGGGGSSSSSSSNSNTNPSNSGINVMHQYFLNSSPHKSVGPHSFSYSAGTSIFNNSGGGGGNITSSVNGSSSSSGGSNSVHNTPTRNKGNSSSVNNSYHLQQYQQHLHHHHQHQNSYSSSGSSSQQSYNNGGGGGGPAIIFRSALNGHGVNSNGGGGDLNLIMDAQFLGYLFKNYFHGIDKLVLPLVCKYWRDTTYSLGREFWDSNLLPVLNCKEIRHELLNCAGVRRRFYSALHKRGFTSLKLLGATDDDAEDVLIHFSQGSNLIQSLKLYNSSLSDKGLYSLLDHLCIVDHLELVSCNEITEDGIIKALPARLTSIVLMDCIHVADGVFSAIARRERLDSFSIQSYHVTDSALSSFNSKVNSNLTTLKLNSCWELTNQALLHIVSSLPHLETLSLSGCSKITDEGVEILAENLNVLKCLDLSWCSRLSDSCLECIACDLVSLEQLVLDRLSLITDLGVGYLATMSSLRLLSLRWCSSVRDQSIHHIISIKKLQYLSIAGCTSISPGSLTKLSSLREIRELELTNCGVTPSVIQYLRNTLQNCLVIE